MSDPKTVAPAVAPAELESAVKPLLFLFIPLVLTLAYGFLVK